MMNCRQATRLMSDAQERQLSFKERMALKIHNLLCPPCHHFGGQLGTIREVSRLYVKKDAVAASTDSQSNSADDRGKPHK